MARSRFEQVKGRIIQLMIVALVFGFVPYMLFQAACGETNQAKVNEQYSGAPKRFGAPPPSPAPTPAAKPAVPPADP